MAGAAPALIPIEMETRTLSAIKHDLADATERRAALWHELSVSAGAEKSAEVERLSRLIESLWSEARAARNRARFGDPKDVLRKARAEERLERDLARVA